MSKPVNRALVEQLLADDTLSFNEVARRASCSSWSVRAIYRELSGDERPMKTPSAQPGEADDYKTAASTASAWAGLGVVALAVIACVALRMRIGRIDFGSDSMT